MKNTVIIDECNIPCNRRTNETYPVISERMKERLMPNEELVNAVMSIEGAESDMLGYLLEKEEGSEVWTKASL